jgi:hypothetical protein
MRQNIFFVILLLGAFSVWNESFGSINNQTSEIDSVLAKKAKQDTETTAPAPRIMYRDVINQLSDSIVILNQTLEEIVLRLEKITLEKESLSTNLLEATTSIDEPEIEREKGLAGEIKSVWFFLVLAIVFIVIAILFFACNSAINKAKQKALQYDELAEEFENYRKASRERFEKQAIEHFKELKKLNKI